MEQLLKVHSVPYVQALRSSKEPENMAQKLSTSEWALRLKKYFKKTTQLQKKWHKGPA